MHVDPTEKPRRNRRFVAGLAAEVLVPLVRRVGKRTPGSRRMPSHQTLDLGELTVLLAEEDMLAFGGSSILDVRGADSKKVLSLRLDPLEVVSFHDGPWVDQVIELALDRCSHPAG